jgi:hypothetical protein
VSNSFSAPHLYIYIYTHTHTHTHIYIYIHQTYTFRHIFASSSVTTNVFTDVTCILDLIISCMLLLLFLFVIICKAMFAIKTVFKYYNRLLVALIIINLTLFVPCIVSVINNASACRVYVLFTANYKFCPEDRRIHFNRDVNLRSCIVIKYTYVIWLNNCFLI